MCIRDSIIAGTVDEEARKELMKIDNPDMEKVRKAANMHERQQNSMKSAPSTSRAYQIKSNSNKTITCYACGENGHKSIECKKSKESLNCRGKRSKIQATPDTGCTRTIIIWSEWRLTVIAATVRIALVDILDLSEVDIPAGGFLYPAVGWG